MVHAQNMSARATGGVSSTKNPSTVTPSLADRYYSAIVPLTRTPIDLDIRTGSGPAGGERMRLVSQWSA